MLSLKIWGSLFHLFRMRDISDNGNTQTRGPRFVSVSRTHRTTPKDESSGGRSHVVGRVSPGGPSIVRPETAFTTVLPAFSGWVLRGVECRVDPWVRRLSDKRQRTPLGPVNNNLSGREPLRYCLPPHPLHDDIPASLSLPSVSCSLTYTDVAGPNPSRLRCGWTLPSCWRRVCEGFVLKSLLVLERRFCVRENVVDFRSL